MIDPLSKQREKLSKLGWKLDQIYELEGEYSAKNAG